MPSRPSTSAILPWRYGLFLLVLALAAPLALVLGPAAGLMLGFDGAVLALLATLPALRSHGAAQMRAHARRNDANRTFILVLTAIVMGVIFVVIASELQYARAPGPWLMALIVATLLCAWLFSNIVYAFHYAWLFYRERPGGGDRGGLDVPGTAEPDYWDFAYFAFTLGMTFQTSDVAIGDPAIRRVVLFHSLAAFVFNLGIVAFTINLLGS